MSDPITVYLEHGFDQDVQRLVAANGRGVSVVSLAGGQGARSGGFAEHARAFAGMARRDWFLWAFYFQALLDQAVYSATGADLARWGRPEPLKLVGILGSSHSNLHPALLLLVATQEVAADAEEQAVREFENLTRLEMERFRVVLEAIRRDQPVAVDRTRTELSNGVALLFQPRSLGAYSRRAPRLPLFERWAEVAARAVNGLRREAGHEAPGPP